MLRQIGSTFPCTKINKYKLYELHLYGVSYSPYSLFPAMHAVVCSEHHGGILPQVELIQRIQEFAHLLIYKAYSGAVAHHQLIAHLAII
jgi:hypothetical protein